MNTPEQQKIAHELSVYGNEVVRTITDDTVSARAATVYDIMYILCEVFKSADSTFSVVEFFNTFNDTQKP